MLYCQVYILTTNSKGPSNESTNHDSDEGDNQSSDEGTNYRGQVWIVWTRNLLSICLVEMVLWSFYVNTGHFFRYNDVRLFRKNKNKS